MVNGRLLAAVQRADLAHDEGEQDSQDRRCDEKNERQFRAEQERHAQPHHQHDRAAHKGTQPRIDGVEQYGGVGGHAGNEGRRRKMVKVGKVEFLHGCILGQAQFGCKAVGKPGRKPGVQQAGDERQHRAQSHQPALPKNDAHIMAGHALIHQGGHQDRNHHFKDTFDKDQPRCRPKVPAIGLAITKK